MRHLWPTIVAIKNKAGSKVANHLFTQQQFNVQPWYPAANLGSPIISKIQNQVAKALNEQDYLPSYIIIALDKDMVEDTNFGGFGCKTIFENDLSWLCDKINEDIELRRQDLINKRPGAVTSEDWPKIIWISMVVQPYITNTNRGFVFAQCGTFNATLLAITKKY